MKLLEDNLNITIETESRPYKLLEDHFKDHLYDHRNWKYFEVVFPLINEIETR